MNLKEKDINQLPKHKKIHLINGITGTKAANLIGTVNENGQENLAVFSSVIHIGSDPALVAFVLRQGKVARHTYENIVQTKFYTINHIHKGIYKQAHQSSAKYEEGESEFDATNLVSEYIDNFPAPYVKEAKIKFALELQEIVPIKSNGTQLIVGKIKEIHIPDDLVFEHGFIDLEKAGTLTLSGLDGYYELNLLARLSYAETHLDIKEIKKDSNGKQ